MTGLKTGGKIKAFSHKKLIFQREREISKAKRGELEGEREFLNDLNTGNL